MKKKIKMLKKNLVLYKHTGYVMNKGKKNKKMLYVHSRNYLGTIKGLTTET